MTKIKIMQKIVYSIRTVNQNDVAHVSGEDLRHLLGEKNHGTQWHGMDWAFNCQA